jgi:hypothetical protein
MITRIFFILFILSGVVHAQPEMKITAEDAEAWDYFGFSVSIDGDFAVIGAYKDDDDSSCSGSAYIFARSGANWIQQAKLTADDAAAWDHFGYSVSISGDYAVIGAYGVSGSAYIFVRDGDNWTQQAKLTVDDAARHDYFGFSVSISGDYAVIGAHGDDDGGNQSGSAYIFVREGENWTEQAKLTADDAAMGAIFGYSVSISNDYLVIGANYDDWSGSAYIFARDGADWTQQTKLTANDAARLDQFGWSVSISGDYAVIGATHNDDDGENSGSAYIFVRDGANWTQQAKLTADDAAADDRFGWSVSISSNYAVIGATHNDDDGDRSGSAYIFVRDGADWTEQAKLTADDAAAGDNFGWSVSINGDYAVIGAYGGEDSGSAYIYNLGENNIERHEDTASIPTGFFISHAYPNPFNSTTTITYGLGTPSPTRLAIYDLAGRKIVTLFDGYKQAGNHTATLSANDLPTGIYFVQLKASDQVFTQKIMLIR